MTPTATISLTKTQGVVGIATLTGSPFTALDYWHEAACSRQFSRSLP